MQTKRSILKINAIGIFLFLALTMYGNISGHCTLPFTPQDRAEQDSDGEIGITTGGTISANETLCGSGIPDIILNESEPTGEVEGFVVFQWEKRSPGETWTTIPGATGLTYEPGTISTTTLYRRGCHESTEQPWIYSNEVTKKVVPNIAGVQYFTNPVTCKGGSDGSIHITVAGGTPAYLFDWSATEETGNDLNDLEAGTYTVEVTDQNGCTFTSEEIEVKEPEIGIGLTEAFTFEPTCAGGENGVIYIEAFDGTLPYSYDWSNGENTPNIVGLSSGSYEVTVTDALGCSITKTDIILQEPKLIKLLNQSVPATCFDSLDGSVTLSAAGGTAPYYYQWPDGEYGSTRSELAAGTYTIEVIDNNGCHNTDVIEIVHPEKLTASQYLVNNKTCKATVNVLPTGGNPPYSYEWEDGSTDGLRSSLCPGIYTVQITDKKGCKTEESLEIKTEIKEEDISIKVIVNPFHLEGHIIIELPFNDFADVRIYSPTGQLIEEFKRQESEENQEIKLALDIDRYSNGVYIVEVLSGGLSTSEKIIISN